MNSADTFLNILSKLALAYLVNPLIVRKCASLMEFAEELINFKGTVVEHKFVPESALLDGAYLLVVTDDLLEIPGECENICMLLLIECHVDPKFPVFLFDIDGGLILLLHFDLGRIISAGISLSLNGPCGSQKRHDPPLRANQSSLSTELSHNLLHILLYIILIIQL